jgi:hypothetical protein
VRTSDVYGEAARRQRLDERDHVTGHTPVPGLRS